MLSVLGSLGLVASIAGALGLTARAVQVGRRGPGPDVAGPARVLLVGSIVAMGAMQLALVGLGWMAWDGNGEIEPALGMFDQALTIEPGSATALYLKGKVLWCGVGDLGEAERLLTTVISNGDLPGESMALVESELQAVRRGEACS